MELIAFVALERDKCYQAGLAAFVKIARHLQVRAVERLPPL
ncbi:MAG TPA: hypothetical protein VH186_14205 [Chloroflexia bacterium]|nr:hypothetical protein [Chloroflexia bacterium]